MPTIQKAILLAAGFGTRLRPLTLSTPKPLLPLDGYRLIDFGLGLLSKSGVTEIAINLHHLGHQIREYLGDGSHRGLKIHYSDEKSEILETGGGVKTASQFFPDEPLIVLNSDAILNVDMALFTKRHFDSRASVTMALKPLAPGDTYQPIAVDDDGWVTDVNGVGKHFYVGLQILTPEFLKTLPPAGTKSCLVKDGYRPFLSNGGRIASFIYDGYFNDVGTLERYEKARRDLNEGLLQATF